jgi:hypothetical protein
VLGCEVVCHASKERRAPITCTRCFLATGHEGRVLRERLRVDRLHVLPAADLRVWVKDGSHRWGCPANPASASCPETTREMHVSCALGLLLLLAVGGTEAAKKPMTGFERRAWRPIQQAMEHKAAVDAASQDVYDHFTGESYAGRTFDSGIRLVAPPPQRRSRNKEVAREQDLKAIREGAVELDAWRESGYVLPDVHTGAAAPLPGQTASANTLELRELVTQVVPATYVQTVARTPAPQPLAQAPLPVQQLGQAPLPFDPHTGTPPALTSVAQAPAEEVVIHGAQEARTKMMHESYLIRKKDAGKQEESAQTGLEAWRKQNGFSNGRRLLVKT